MKAVGKAKEHPPPDLYDDLLFIWEAFLALSSSRSGWESIKFSEIESWLNLNSLSDLEQRQEVTHLIRVMDIEYLDFLREEQKRKKK